jgi:hypothetical protein
VKVDGGRDWSPGDRRGLALPRRGRIGSPEGSGCSPRTAPASPCGGARPTSGRCRRRTRSWSFRAARCPPGRSPRCPLGRRRPAASDTRRSSLETTLKLDLDHHLGGLTLAPSPCVFRRGSRFSGRVVGVLGPLRPQAARYGPPPPASVRTLEEVGREFGVTRERIRQIEAADALQAPPPFPAPKTPGLSGGAGVEKPGRLRGRAKAAPRRGLLTRPLPHSRGPDRPLRRLTLRHADLRSAECPRTSPSRSGRPGSCHRQGVPSTTCEAIHLCP